ncbi:MAG: hypothetical protein V3V28_01435 [Polaribacter sp.]|uniref:hypothetical protein n=1 Tax=Polaribacter sp. TaxID=1920175 RepID=UPI002F352E39
MKKTYLLLFLLFTTYTYSQKKEKFKSGVELTEAQKGSSYNTPKSILFEFSGNTHLIYFYKDLSKKIKKSFRKSGIKVKFNYNLVGGNFKEDLKEIPKKKHSSLNFKSLCKIELSNSKHFKNKYADVKKRKQQFNLKINLLEKEKIILFATLEVKTFFTILTQNKEVSKLLLKVLTE